MKTCASSNEICLWTSILQINHFNGCREPIDDQCKEGMVKDVCFIDYMYYKWKDFLSYLVGAIKDLDGHNSIILKVVANQ